MRFLTVLLVTAATMATANAAPWTDPSNTISLDAPAGWVVEAPQAEGLTYVVAASAASECHVVGVPRASTADTPVYRIRDAAARPITAEMWTQIAGMFPSLFPGAVTVQSSNVSTDGYWPVQRADYAVAGNPTVHGAIQFRPGIELWALCRARTVGQTEELPAYETLFSSIGTPNDATLQADADRQQREAEEDARHRRTQMLGDRGPIGSSWGTNTQ